MHSRLKIALFLVLFITSNNLLLRAQTIVSEPIAQASNVLFTTIKSYRIAAQFSPSSPASDGYIVLRSINAEVKDIPEDGMMYQRGDVIGESQVVSVGLSTNFTLNGVVANTEYHFSIFSFNGSDTLINYLTDNPLLAKAVSLNSMPPPNYYGAISISDANFVNDLHHLINAHKKQSYSGYSENFLGPFIARDTTNNQRVVTCIYSGENLIYSPPWIWTELAYSREHTYPKSWMPTVDDSNFENLPEYSDYHQLFPINQNKVNAVRSNYPLGEVVNETSSYLEAKIGFNNLGQKVFEPRNSKKGDVARAIMYQAVCYHGVDDNNWSFPNPISSSIPYGQNQSILKKWHYQDPPDNYEIARNDFLDSLQNNRNPFIDQPDFACYIDFSSMTYIPNPELPCNIVSVKDTQKEDSQFTVVPNPNKGNMVLNYSSLRKEKVKLELMDIAGSVIFQKVLIVEVGNKSYSLNVGDLAEGIYLLKIQSKTLIRTSKVVIEE